MLYPDVRRNSVVACRKIIENERMGSTTTPRNTGKMTINSSLLQVSGQADNSEGDHVLGLERESFFETIHWNMWGQFSAMNQTIDDFHS